MLYMIIERFHNGDPVPVYARFKAQGRLMPEGITYVSSWTSVDLTHCYQVMETQKRELLNKWIDEWKDIVDFEIVPVVTSAEASAGVQELEKGKTDEGAVEGNIK